MNLQTETVGASKQNTPSTRKLAWLYEWFAGHWGLPKTFWLTYVLPTLLFHALIEWRAYRWSIETWGFDVGSLVKILHEMAVINNGLVRIFVAGIILNSIYGMAACIPTWRAAGLHIGIWGKITRVIIVVCFGVELLNLVGVVFLLLWY